MQDDSAVQILKMMNAWLGDRENCFTAFSLTTLDEFEGHKTVRKAFVCTRSHHPLHSR
jgi:hypothetical protein